LPGRAVFFIWVGGETRAGQIGGLRYDIAKSRLEKWTHFLGHVDDPLSHYAACDVFALVSREDPCPLVMLEAASLGKPIVCFDGSGGAVEFVENDAGQVVPYLDVEEMATAVALLLENDALRCRMGRRGAERVAGRHSVEIAGPNLVQIIERLSNSRPVLG
jgi:glycosyltransferase involved in cell wall biosynthesis